MRVILGRPNRSKSKCKKPTGKDDEIARLLGKKIFVSGISRLLGVHRLLVAAHIKNHLATPSA